MLKIIECPRDAMQGYPTFIPTAVKIEYLNTLLQVGFDTLDCGSFVSAKAIPQMQDTPEVLAHLNIQNSKTKLLTIVANLRGAEIAASFKQISYLGFPLSLSETFQQRNTHKSISEAFKEIDVMQAVCHKNNKELVVYLSMGFGNPYGDLWQQEFILEFVHKLAAFHIKTISLADTIGIAEPETIYQVFNSLIPAFKRVEFGAHFHSRPETGLTKIKAAYDAGCRRFDGALNGIGGCPMAADKLVGNLATENIITYFENNNLPLNLDKLALNRALKQVNHVFPFLHA